MLVKLRHQTEVNHLVMSPHYATQQTPVALWTALTVV